MIRHIDIPQPILHRKIKNKEITFAGNQKLKIYGLLKCKSGKRMKKENRAFFKSEEQALKNGYRPCGHCMNLAYKNWKTG